MPVKIKPLPSVETLKEIFDYNPETGLLVWKNRTNSRNWAGKEAGTKHNQGYKKVTVYGETYLIHRIIWKLVTGNEAEEIDHIDGVRANNKVENLRAVTAAENHKNTQKSSKNTSGVTGVLFENRTRKPVARIKVNGVTISLGTFDTFEAAVFARKAAEIKYKFHKNHGRVGPGQAVPTVQQPGDTTVQALPVKPGVQELIDLWHKSKETEKAWQEYRGQLEEAISKHYETEFLEVRAALAQSTQLSESAKIGDLKVSLGRTMKIEQAAAAGFCAAHPELIGVVLKYKFEAANSSSLLGAMFADGALGEQVSKIVELKDSKPSFSKA